MYDLRSDTFTLPSTEMRKAIYDAEVGDDVYGEDPTVNRLERMAEEITGKERALLISSGCMGNLIPMMLKGGRGKEIICAKESHIVNHEIGAIASLSGTLPVYADSEYGILKPESVREKIHLYSYDMSESAMLEVENTTSGLIYPLETMKELKQIAEEYKLWLHLDGARIFNASVESGISVKEYASNADDITFCLSKGLGAPAFSLLCGDKDFIESAKRLKKILGGGMRQVGLLAAAGIYALEHNVERLKIDHQNREKVSDALKESGWADVKISATNMIFFTSTYSIGNIIAAFRKRDILFLNEGNMGRMVLSLNVSEEDTEYIVRTIKEIDPKEFE